VTPFGDENPESGCTLGLDSKRRYPYRCHPERSEGSLISQFDHTISARVTFTSIVRSLPSRDDNHERSTLRVDSKTRYPYWCHPERSEGSLISQFDHAISARVTFASIVRSALRPVAIPRWDDNRARSHAERVFKDGLSLRCHPERSEGLAMD